jgi:hypothetical protein
VCDSGNLCLKQATRLVLPQRQCKVWRSCTFALPHGKLTRASDSGIGFIGAGAVVHQTSHNVIHGLTSAATIWLVMAIGICTGLGWWFIAALCTSLALVVLCIFRVNKPKLSWFASVYANRNLRVCSGCGVVTACLQSTDSVGSSPLCSDTSNQLFENSQLFVLLCWRLSGSQMQQLVVVLRAELYINDYLSFTDALEQFCDQLEVRTSFALVHLTTVS